MGTVLPQLHRRFSMRSPLTRAVALSLAVLILLLVAFSSESADLGRVIINSAHFRQQGRPSSTQKPVSSGGAGPDAAAMVELGGENVTASWARALSCDDDLDHLRALGKRYGLQDRFEYYKRHVRVIRRDGIPRESMTVLDQPLAPKKAKFTLVDVADGLPAARTCPAPLDVPVAASPFPSSANLSDFMFAVSTTPERFNAPKTSSVREWSYWLTDSAGRSNGGKLVLLLVNATRPELDDAAMQLANVGIDADVFRAEPDDPMAVRYLSLVPAMYTHPDRPRKRWLVVCDDDTFFPSPNALVEKLARYDPSRPYYIGTLSEDINNVQRHGSQAFGGAGVFISAPLAAEITSRYTECTTETKIREADSGWGPQGDIMLRKCIYEHSDVRLTNLWDLWQLDLVGDPSGFFESGIRPLSLHHYRGGGPGWPLAHPYEYTKVSHLCGEDCMMQRFRTADDWVLSTSFSVVHYPKGLADLDFAQFERTFSPAPDDKGWNLDFVLGPQRKSLLRSGRKISWDLQESTLTRHGGGRVSVSQVYVRKQSDWRWFDGRDDKPMSRADGVIELVWISS